MTTLGQMLTLLGPGVLTVLAAPAGTDVDVAGVVIHDPSDPPPISAGNLVLAVGLTPGADLRRLMERVVAERAVLVVKASEALGDTESGNAQALGLTLVAVAPGAAWMQIASLLRSAIVDDAAARGNEELGGVAAGDLFALANAIAALVDAPVTIEDRQARVIAFSTRQDEADAARMSTILGRQVPESYYRRLQEKGVFRTLYRGDEPLYIDDIGPEVLPRIAVAVKAGDEVLGSIWAAVRQPPDRERMRIFGEAATFVALHLLRHRIAADVQRELQSSLVSVLLNGGPLAEDVARRLGLRGDGFRVLAVALRDAGDDDGTLARVWDLLVLHLSTLHRGAVTALVQGSLHAVLPLAGDRQRSRRAAVTAGTDFTARLPEPLHRRVVVGVGGHAAVLAELPRSREDADRIARILAGRSPAESRAVAAIEEMSTAVLLLRMSEMGAAGSLDDGPLNSLLDHDRSHHSRYVETLRAWLEEFGDVGRAAARIGVHHNTFRYRLQKLRELPGVDLDDSEQRLGLLLQLRLRGADLSPRAGRGGAPR